MIGVPWLTNALTAATWKGIANIKLVVINQAWVHSIFFLAAPKTDTTERINHKVNKMVMPATVFESIKQI